MASRLPEHRPARAVIRREQCRFGGVCWVIQFPGRSPDRAPHRQEWQQAVAHANEVMTLVRMFESVTR